MWACFQRCRYLHDKLRKCGLDSDFERMFFHKSFDDGSIVSWSFTRGSWQLFSDVLQLSLVPQIYADSTVVSFFSESWKEVIPVFCFRQRNSINDGKETASSLLETSIFEGGPLNVIWCWIRLIVSMVFLNSFCDVPRFFFTKSRVDKRLHFLLNSCSKIQKLDEIKEFNLHL